MRSFHLSLTALSMNVLSAHGAVFKYSIFNDTNCTQEVYTDVIYRPIVETKNDSTHVLGDFGQCHVYEEPKGDVKSYLVDCDLSFVAPYHGFFTTDECCAAMFDSDSSPDCPFSVKSLSGTSCGDGVPSAVEGVGSSWSSECDLEDGDGPSIISSEAVVNYVAIEYYDPNCTDSTGENVVISSVLVDEVVMIEIDHVREPDIFSFGHWLQFGITGTGAYCRGASECRANGTLVSQYNALSNGTCSDEVGMETLISNDFIAVVYKYRCSQLEVDGFYYRPIACTTENATVGADATYSPTPMPENAIVGADATYSPTPMPENAIVGADATYSPTPMPENAIVGADATYSPTPMPEDDRNAGTIPGIKVTVLGMASTTCVLVALAISSMW